MKWINCNSSSTPCAAGHGNRYRDGHTFTGGRRVAATWWPIAFHHLASVAFDRTNAGSRAAGEAVAIAAAVRLLVLALVKFALPPLVSLPIGLFSQMGPTVRNAPAELAVHAAVDASPLTVEAPSQAMAPGNASPAAVTLRLADLASVPAVVTPMDPKAWWMLLHLAGAVAVAAWVVRELWVVRGLLRRATEVRTGELHERFLYLCRQLGLRRPPRLLVLAELCGPAAFGVVRPAVLLPEAVSQLPPEEADVILAHELAHHRRRDLWVNWFQVALSISVVQPVLWA